MRIGIRADASELIGTGHVTRCATFGQKLVSKGAEVFFICRNQVGNKIEWLRLEGFDVLVLEGDEDCYTKDKCEYIVEHTGKDKETPSNTTDRLSVCSTNYPSWLEVSWSRDASETYKAIAEYLSPLSQDTLDWLVVDHYALNASWHEALQPITDKICVIDDLADRAFSCHLLLDQNLGRHYDNYAQKVHQNCKLLLGTDYSLIREEFLKYRTQALKKRESTITITTILITMGGVDRLNTTETVVNLLMNSDGLTDSTTFHIVIIATSQYPHLDSLRALQRKYSDTITLLINVTNMAQLMYEADLSIGASGTTSWERAVVGLPSILVTLADNQMIIANELHKNKAAYYLGHYNEISQANIDKAIQYMMNRKNYLKIAKNSSQLCDGLGTEKVADELMRIHA